MSKFKMMFLKATLILTFGLIFNLDSKGAVISNATVMNLSNPDFFTEALVTSGTFEGFIAGTQLQSDAQLLSMTSNSLSGKLGFVYSSSEAARSFGLGGGGAGTGSTERFAWQISFDVVAEAMERWQVTLVSDLNGSVTDAGPVSSTRTHFSVSNWNTTGNVSYDALLTHGNFEEIIVHNEMASFSEQETTSFMGVGSVFVEMGFHFDGTFLSTVEFVTADGVVSNQGSVRSGLMGMSAFPYDDYPGLDNRDVLTDGHVISLDLSSIQLVPLPSAASLMSIIGFSLLNVMRRKRRRTMDHPRNVKILDRAKDGA